MIDTNYCIKQQHITKQNQNIILLRYKLNKSKESAKIDNKYYFTVGLITTL